MKLLLTSFLLLFSSQLLATTLFTSDNFLIRKNHGQHRTVNGNQEIVLLEESEYANAGILFLKEEFSKPYILNFEYSLYDTDGGKGYPYNWHSADGLAIGIGKNYNSYESRRSRLPGGGSLGFVADGRACFKNSLTKQK